MNTLKLLTNALKANVCLIRSNKLNQKQLWCLRRVAIYSPVVFIRNTGGSVLSTTTWNSKQPNLLLSQLERYVCTPIYNTSSQFGTKNAPDRANKSDTKSAAITDVDLFGETSKLGLFDKFKLMYKKYWYVLIPVHVVTSATWMCGLYYLSKSGMDVPSLLQHLHLSEAMLEKVKNSNLGHWAIAYLCFKVATPLRYAVTLGGTTVSIKYLVQHGYIKPIPSKEELVRMYEKQKASRAAVKAHCKDEEDPKNK